MFGKSKLHAGIQFDNDPEGFRNDNKFSAFTARVNVGQLCLYDSTRDYDKIRKTQEIHTNIVSFINGTELCRARTIEYGSDSDF